MDEKKMKKWGMRIYYVLAILFFVFIHVPTAEWLGRLMAFDDPYVWFYVLTVGIAICYLGRFWWIYPLIYWPYADTLIRHYQSDMSKYGDGSIPFAILRSDTSNIIIVLLSGLVIYFLKSYLVRRIRND